MVQQACLGWEGRVEEEMKCQSVFSLAWWDTCSPRLALREFFTDCLIWSSIKLSLMGFNTCGMRNVQKKQKNEVTKEKYKNIRRDEIRNNENLKKAWNGQVWHKLAWTEREASFAATVMRLNQSHAMDTSDIPPIQQYFTEFKPFYSS